MKQKTNVLLVSLFIALSTQAFAQKNATDLQPTPLGFYENPIFTRAVAPVLDSRIRSPQPSALARFTRVKDQNPLGTCVSFAVTGCAERWYPKKSFSEAEFTILIESTLPKRDYGDCKAGAFLGKALEVARDYGFVEEERLPYIPYVDYVAKKNHTTRRGLYDFPRPDICVKLYNARKSYNTTMQALQNPLQLTGTQSDRTRFRLTHLEVLHHAYPQKRGGIGQYGMTNLALIKDRLSSGYDVPIAIDTFEGCWSSSTVTAKHPVIETPDLDHKVKTGAHAVILRGYDDRRNAFLIQNSWGTSWGKGGTAYLPYTYAQRHITEAVAVSK